jgi:hypothetical protein
MGANLVGGIEALQKIIDPMYISTYIGINLEYTKD